VAAVFLAYQPAWHGRPPLGRRRHLTGEDLAPWGGLWRIWFEPGATQQYYPLVHSAFWSAPLWGDDPTGYHFVNLALHGTGRPGFWRVLAPAHPGALLAAAIFGCTRGRSNPSPGSPSLKHALGRALPRRRAGLVRFERKREPGAWVLSWRSSTRFLSGSKTVTATLPAAWLLLHWWRVRAPLLAARRGSLLPFFALGAAAGIITLFGRAAPGGRSSFDRTIVDPTRAPPGSTWESWLAADLVFI